MRASTEVVEVIDSFEWALVDGALGSYGKREHRRDREAVSHEDKPRLITGASIHLVQYGFASDLGLQLVGSSVRDKAGLSGSPQSGNFRAEVRYANPDDFVGEELAVVTVVLDSDMRSLGNAEC